MSELPVGRPRARASVVDKGAAQAAGRANTDLATAIALSLIGLLFALNVMLRFPDIGALIARYNQF